MSSQHQDTEHSFAFNSDNKKRISDLLTHYPEERKQSALLPLLWMAQRQNKGWLSESALKEVAQILKVPFLRVYEVATFYTMFRLKPVGKNFVQLCRTTSCWLRGSDKLREACTSFLKIGPGETTDDGFFSFEEVECLGACANAPVVQINDHYFEDLTPQTLQRVLEDLSQNLPVKPGSQEKRVASKACLPHKEEGS